jgi:hypothetical protein
MHATIHDRGAERLPGLQGENSRRSSRCSSPSRLRRTDRQHADITQDPHTRDTIATTMDIREIDWSTAEVTDKRTLTVALTADSDVDWCAEFTAVARLLDAGSHNRLWGEVGARAKKAGDQIVVKELEIDDPQHVERLRDFLDAVARQASANVAEPDEDADEAGEDSPAARSTRAFRALAEDREP